MKKILLTGGGTGGHIYPALAVAHESLRQVPDVQFMYIGSENGLEKDIVTRENIPFQSIRISGFRRSLSWQNVRTVIRFFQAVRRSRRLMRDFRPDIVVGTGGFVAGPVVYAAYRLGIPCLIHEQNAMPGLTNRFLSRYADCVAVSFDEPGKQFPQAKRAVYTGNPRATSVTRADAGQGYSSLDIPAGAPLVLVVGGSRGALAINEAMVAMSPLLSRLPHVYFVYVTGKTYYEETRSRLTEVGMSDHVRVIPYMDNMPDVLAACTLVVGRAGASSLAEITALGIPSILIPSPNVTGNHQEANARALADQGAAIMIREPELTGERLFQEIERIINDPIRREHMSKRSSALGCPDAAEQVFQEMLKLVQEKGHRTKKG